MTSTDRGPRDVPHHYTDAELHNPAVGFQLEEDFAGIGVADMPPILFSPTGTSNTDRTMSMIPCRKSVYAAAINPPTMPYVENSRARTTME